MEEYDIEDTFEDFHNNFNLTFTVDNLHIFQQAVGPQWVCQESIKRLLNDHEGPSGKQYAYCVYAWLGSTDKYIEDDIFSDQLTLFLINCLKKYGLVENQTSSYYEHLDNALSSLQWRCGK